jgi:hypothetical protein
MGLYANMSLKYKNPGENFLSFSSFWQVTLQQLNIYTTFIIRKNMYVRIIYFKDLAYTQVLPCQLDNRAQNLFVQL